MTVTGITTRVSRTADSLGTTKSNLGATRVATKEVSAAEYNALADGLVAVQEEVGKHDGSEPGTLVARMAEAEDAIADVEASVTALEANTAPVGASFVTLGTNGTLTDERVLAVAGALSLTDGGAGGNATITAERTANNWAFAMPSYGTVVRHYRRTDCCGIESGMTDGFYRISGSTLDASLQEAGANGVIATGQANATAYARIQGCTTTAGTEEIPALGTGLLTHRVRVRFKIPTISTSGHRFFTIVGLFGPANTVAPTDGVFLFGQDDVNSHRWVVRARAASVDTDVNTAVALDTGWHVAELQVSGTAAEIWLDGVSLGTLNSGFPTTNLTHGVAYGKTTGSSSARRVNVDWIDHAWARTGGY